MKLYSNQFQGMTGKGDDFMALINKKKLEDLGQRVASAAQSGVAKSRRLAEIAKLKGSNLSEEEAIKKTYMEIGKLYYAERGGAPEGAYVALCSRISRAKDVIEENNARIQALKTQEDEEEITDAEAEEAAAEFQETVTEEEPVISGEEDAAGEEIPDEE